MGQSDSSSASPVLIDSGQFSTHAPDLLCFSHLRWDFVTQRPQHLLTRAAKERRVFFWEEPIWHHPGTPDALPDRADGNLGMHLEILQEAPSLWIVKPHISWGIDFEAGQHTLLRDLIEQFSILEPIRWYYTPMAFDFSADVPASAVVYDSMDELKNFLNPPPGLAEREQSLMRAADVVFTGGISLYESKRHEHTNAHPFPSSIDVEHFAQAKSGTLTEPDDQAAVPHPRAGFYGVVDERFDVELLRGVAALRPEVNFIVLGPVVKIDPAVLPQATNIHYLGSKSYEQLPAYLSGWDVALLPFALNDATKYISPTKTPEYLAAGKPVISTPIRDVVRGYGDSGLVAIAGTAEQFAAAIDAALQPQPESWRKAVQANLAQGSWDATWASMREQIDAVLQSARAHGHAARSASHGVQPTMADLRIDRLASVQRTFVPRQREKFDYVVVGAGFAGSVLAERLASQGGKRVLLIDKREHIAGNAYDFHDAAGILVHKYGPHIFHTNSEAVFNYLSRFTAWRPYEHRVLASVDEQLLPIPINLDTVNRLYNLSLDAAGLEAFLSERREAAPVIRTSEDIVVSRVGRELYEKFFRNYTRKQWGLDPSQLDAAVAGRIPVRFDRDDRYFSDAYQAMPLEGYTRMFERMLDHPRITVRTGVDYADAARAYKGARLVFTGPIDEFYAFRFGPLPYRSLEFKHETHNRERFQAAPVVNYPNEHAYTRITEFKCLTGQEHRQTSIVYEYPRAEGDPYYPIPRPENAAIYAKYKALADRDEHVTFCGRLANYRYFNMDQVVAQALTTFRDLVANDAVALTTAAKQARTAAATLRKSELAEAV